VKQRDVTREDEHRKLDMEIINSLKGYHMVKLSR